MVSPADGKIARVLTVMQPRQCYSANREPAMNTQICNGGSHGLEGVPEGATTFPCPICKAHAEVMWPRRTADGGKPLPRLEPHKPALQHFSVAGRT
jgi:hypothetical protein